MGIINSLFGKEKLSVYSFASKMIKHENRYSYQWKILFEKYIKINNEDALWVESHLISLFIISSTISAREITDQIHYALFDKLPEVKDLLTENIEERYSGYSAARNGFLIGDTHILPYEIFNAFSKPQDLAGDNPENSFYPLITSLFTKQIENIKNEIDEITKTYDVEGLTIEIDDKPTSSKKSPEWTVGNARKLLKKDITFRILVVATILWLIVIYEENYVEDFLRYGVVPPLVLWGIAWITNSNIIKNKLTRRSNSILPQNEKEPSLQSQPGTTNQVNASQVVQDNDIEMRLEKLQSLKARGLITEQEYTEKKQDLLKQL